MRKLVFYPELVGFIEEEKDKFPTVKVQYAYNSPPKLIMLDKDGQLKETIRWTYPTFSHIHSKILHWKFRIYWYILIFPHWPQAINCSKNLKGCSSSSGLALVLGFRTFNCHITLFWIVFGLYFISIVAKCKWFRRGHSLRCNILCTFSCRIDNWKKEHILQFLKEKVKRLSEI